MDRLAEELRDYPPESVTFELISNRFTPAARKQEVFPDTTLPMDEAECTFKFGQFGYGKYVYPKEKLADTEDFFRWELNDKFPGQPSSTRCHLPRHATPGRV